MRLLCNCATPHFIYMDNAEEYWIAARGVTRLDGARGKKQVWRPYEPEVFRKQMYCIEQGTGDIVGIFWRPHNISAPPE